MTDRSSLPESWCTGCGRSSRNPVTAPHLACCPESKYRTGPELLDDLFTAHSRALVDDLTKSTHSLAQISDKALSEIERLRRQRLVLARHLAFHREQLRMGLRDLHAFANEIHFLHDEVKTHQTALLEVAVQRDTARKELESERRNATQLVASLQADLEDARSAACELDAKWRIALQAEELAHHQAAAPQTPPKAPWVARVSQGLDRVASRILFGKRASRSLEALDG